MRNLPPKKPREPDPDECCGQGCAVCVWDVFESKKQRYEEELRLWLRRQRLIRFNYFPDIMKIIENRYHNS
jgi:hypothetical protein